MGLQSWTWLSKWACIDVIVGWRLLWYMLIVWSWLQLQVFFLYFIFWGVECFVVLWFIFRCFLVLLLFGVPDLLNCYLKINGWQVHGLYSWLGQGQGLLSCCLIATSGAVGTVNFSELIYIFYPTPGFTSHQRTPTANLMTKATFCFIRCVGFWALHLPTTHRSLGQKGNTISGSLLYWLCLTDFFFFSFAKVDA